MHRLHGIRPPVKDKWYTAQKHVQFYKFSGLWDHCFRLQLDCLQNNMIYNGLKIRIYLNEIK